MLERFDGKLFGCKARVLVSEGWCDCLGDCRIEGCGVVMVITTRVNWGFKASYLRVAFEYAVEISHQFNFALMMLLASFLCQRLVYLCQNLELLHIKDTQFIEDKACVLDWAAQRELLSRESVIEQFLEMYAVGVVKWGCSKCRWGYLGRFGDKDWGRRM